MLIVSALLRQALVRTTFGILATTIVAEAGKEIYHHFRRDSDAAEQTSVS